MKLTVVGCSPSWPNPGGAHSGYLVENDTGRVLLDCGPGVLSRLREHEDWPHLDAIAITHLHLDHSGDLVAWLWGLLTGAAVGSRGPDLWLPPGGAAQLARLASRFEEAFTIREYADGATFAAGGFEITPHEVAHYDEPTFGLRVEHAGTVLAYSADTGPTPALDALARDADLFLCEATLAEGSHEALRGHLTATEAAAVARRAGARRLLLVHRPVELDPDGHEIARDGLTIEL